MTSEQSGPPEDLTVVTAAAAATWESAVVAGFDGRTDGVLVVRRCVDVADLLAVAAAGLARAALVWPELRFLDRDCVRRLAEHGVAVVGVCDPGEDARQRQRLADIGIRSVVAADAGPDIISSTLRSATMVLSRPVGPAAAGYSDPARSLVPPGPPVRVGTWPADPPPPAVADGRVVAVWGSPGAPGRSTIALALADEAARLGSGALLVDADVYGGVQSPMLGLLDESAGLATACRQALTARLDPAVLATLCQAVAGASGTGGGLRVLSGLARVDRWPEIRPAGLQVVLEAARGLASLTVVDCAAYTEEDEELSYDTSAPRRNAATVSILEAADDVLCVVRADPVGITRAVRALVDLRDRFPDLTPRVVANRLRGSVVSGSARDQVDEAFRRFAGVQVSWFVPDDPKGLDAAMVGGRTLAEVAPKSPIRAAVQELASALTGVPLPSRRRR